MMLLACIVAFLTSTLFANAADYGGSDILIPAGLKLRVLPVGDSITYRVGSTDQNGYRLDLDYIIRAGGHSVDFIGTMESGLHNPENRSEGFPGYRIDGILDRLKSDDIMAQRPNLVLVHAGTNDNWISTPDQPYANATARLGNLIDYVVCQYADAVVLVAMLVHNNYSTAQTALFNAAVPGVVDARYQQGFKVAVVNMTVVGGDELADLLHPNNAGYLHMAELWWSAMVEVPTWWWVDAVEVKTTATGTAASTSTEMASVSTALASSACSKPPISFTTVYVYESATTGEEAGGCTQTA